MQAQRRNRRSVVIFIGAVLRIQDGKTRVTPAKIPFEWLPLARSKRILQNLDGVRLTRKILSCRDLELRRRCRRADN
jgi:hypothetical protein